MSASPLPKTTARKLSRCHLIVLPAICRTSMLVVMMGNTMVDVARPAIRAGLHASATGRHPAAGACTLMLASFLMLAGSTADRAGRRVARAVNDEDLSAGLLSAVAERLVAR